MSRQQPDMKSRIAANIGQAIDDSGLSFMEIARRMGGTTSDRTIRRWRDAETTPNQDMLAKFAAVVGKGDLTWFYMPHDEEPVAA